MKRVASRKSLLARVDTFPQARIMVVGDVMIDHFIWGRVNRISPEAPVPVVNVTSESLRLGGAANVVHNIHALGGKVNVSGIAGNDPMGEKVIHDLRSLSISPRGIIVTNERPTTVKTRIIAHSQQVVRFDREEVSPLNPESTDTILAFLKQNLTETDAILISDYGKGTISQQLIAKILALSERDGKLVIVDPKVKNIHAYAGVTMITPNQNEAGEALSSKIVTDDDACEAAVLLRKNVGCESVLITRGEQGMTLLEKNGTCAHIPALATEVYDVTGAGDTVVSAITLALATGASPKVAAIIANYAAGIVVKKIGTACVGREEVKAAILKQDYVVNKGTVASAT